MDGYENNGYRLLYLRRGKKKGNNNYCTVDGKAGKGLCYQRQRQTTDLNLARLHDNCVLVVVVVDQTLWKAMSH